jgi:hypothetical protein
MWVPFRTGILRAPWIQGGRPPEHTRHIQSRASVLYRRTGFKCTALHSLCPVKIGRDAGALPYYIQGPPLIRGALPYHEAPSPYYEAPSLTTRYPRLLTSRPRKETRLAYNVTRCSRGFPYLAIWISISRLRIEEQIKDLDPFLPQIRSRI